MLKNNLNQKSADELLYLPEAIQGTNQGPKGLKSTQTIDRKNLSQRALNSIYGHNGGTTSQKYNALQNKYKSLKNFENTKSQHFLANSKSSVQVNDQIFDPSNNYGPSNSIPKKSKNASRRNIQQRAALNFPSKLDIQVNLMHALSHKNSPT